MLPKCRADRYSEYIGIKPTGHLYHAFKMARAIGFQLNLVVSFNFELTACPPDHVSRQFKLIRDTFGKWVTRPPRAQERYTARPTYAWAIENPRGHLNAHWALHVPVTRRVEFEKKLTEWLLKAAGEIQPGAIKVKKIYNDFGLRRYMLKGSHPAIAPLYGVNPVPQGWVRGKRSGFSRNLGPTQKQQLREAGLYPEARRRIFAATAPL